MSFVWNWPALDVDLSVDNGDTVASVVAANDWLTLPPDELIERLRVGLPRDSERDSTEDARLREEAIFRTNSEVILDSDGAAIGRACIYRPGRYRQGVTSGVVSVGGLTSISLSGIVGVLVGTPTRASRDEAVPLLDGEILLSWASKQAALLAASVDEEEQFGCASLLCALGASTGRLKVAKCDHGNLNVEEIAAWCRDKTLVAVLQDASFELALRKDEHLQLAECMLVTATSRPIVLQQRNALSRRRWFARWPSTKTDERAEEFHARTAVGAIVKGLAKGWECDEASIWDCAERSSDEKEGKIQIGRAHDHSIVEQVDLFKNPRALT